MGVRRFDRFRWEGVEVQTYKDAPGSWVGVTRQTLAHPESALFEARYFEIAPGGYTTLERHEHEHVVIVVRGSGEVRLGEETTPLAPFDVVHVRSREPHQFQNAGSEPFGIICIVDAERDRPETVKANTDAESGRQRR